MTALHWLGTWWRPSGVGTAARCPCSTRPGAGSTGTPPTVSTTASSAHSTACRWLTSRTGPCGICFSCAPTRQWDTIYITKYLRLFNMQKMKLFVARTENGLENVTGENFFIDCKDFCSKDMKKQWKLSYKIFRYRYVLYGTVFKCWMWLLLSTLLRTLYLPSYYFPRCWEPCTFLARTFWRLLELELNLRATAVWFLSKLLLILRSIALQLHNWKLLFFILPM